MSTCNASETQTLLALVDALCNPVGGIGNVTVSVGNGSSSAGNGSVTGGGSPPSPTAFTGGAAIVDGRMIGWSVMGMVASLGLWVME